MTTDDYKSIISFILIRNRCLVILRMILKIFKNNNVKERTLILYFFPGKKNQ